MKVKNRMSGINEDGTTTDDLIKAGPDLLAAAEQVLKWHDRWAWELSEWLNEKDSGFPELRLAIRNAGGDDQPFAQRMLNVPESASPSPSKR